MAIYVGLTGGVASGKNTVARMFEEKGAVTLDVDDMSRVVMSPGRPAYEKIVEHFGDGIIDRNDRIDRAKLRRIIFNLPQKRKLLEQIVHPAIAEHEKFLVERIKARNPEAVIITQAALMIEKKTHERFNAIILVSCPRFAQVDRLRSRDNISNDEAELILAAQMPTEQKVKFAHMVVDNSGSLEGARLDVDRIWKVLWAHRNSPDQIRASLPAIPFWPKKFRRAPNP